MRPPYRRLAITLLLSLLAACAAVQGQERSHKLLETTQTYLSSLRWGHYDLAARMIINRDTKPKEVDFDFLKKIRVTAYKVTDQLSTQDMSAADLTVTISYYHTEYGTIRTLTDHQAWRYDEDVNAWYLDGNLPDFKAGSAAPR